MFSVIIPTAQKNLDIFNKLLKEIHSSDFIDEIIIINNYPKKFNNPNLPKLKILEQGRNIYVNPAWNLGIKEAKNQYIAILNDDIYIDKNIFKKIEDFISNNENCGLIGLDSIKISKTSDNNAPEKNLEAHIYQTDIRNFCWGCAIFGKKDNFYNIPENLKIWYGDDYLFEQNIKNGKLNYKLFSPNIKHYHSLTSKQKCFNDIKTQDILNYKKTSKKETINTKNYKTRNIFGIKFKINQNKKFDLYVSLGAACSCAQVLKKCKLRRFSCPFDWLYGSDIVNRTKIFANDFKDFINKEDLIYQDTRQNPEPRKIYKNTKNELIFNHDFSYTNTLDEDYPEVYEKYKRRIDRLINTIKNSESVCFVYIQTPNDRKEILNQELIETQQTLAKRFPNIKIFLLHLFCEKGLEYKNANKITISDNILQVRFDYDACNSENPFVANNDVLNKMFKSYKLTLKHVTPKLIIKALIKNIFSINDIQYKSHKQVILLGFKFNYKKKLKKET